MMPSLRLWFGPLNEPLPLSENRLGAGCTAARTLPSRSA